MERYPANEKETIILYQALEGWLGWRIVHLRTAFPDAVIENRRGRQLRAEFEFEARNFLEHGHAPAGCDLVICWQNNWPDAPLPVWALAELPREILEKGLRWWRCWAELREIKGEAVVLEERIKVFREQAAFWRDLATGQMTKGQSLLIWLDKHDAEIMPWLDSQANRLGAVRAALLAHVRRNSPLCWYDEPPELAARLDAQLEEFFWGRANRVRYEKRVITEYAVCCGDCGKRGVWGMTPQEARKLATMVGWQFCQGRMVCPECWEAERKAAFHSELAARLDAQLEEFFREG